MTTMRKRPSPLLNKGQVVRRKSERQYCPSFNFRKWRVEFVRNGELCVSYLVARTGDEAQRKVRKWFSDLGLECPKLEITVQRFPEEPIDRPAN